MATSPALAWFPFYVLDFLSSQAVEQMTLEEVGAYTMLLCHDWKNGGIADISPQRLARLLRIDRRRLAKIWPALAPYFVQHEDGGRWFNPRLEVERARAVAKSEAARDNARIRWSGGSAAAHPTAMRPVSSSHTQSQAQKNTPQPPTEKKPLGISTPEAHPNNGELRRGKAMNLLSLLRAKRVLRQHPGGASSYAIPREIVDALTAQTRGALDVIGGAHALANAEGKDLRIMLYQFASVYNAAEVEA